MWVVPKVAWLCGWDAMHSCEQKSDVWLQRRQLRLTASQIATALGNNPYETRDNLVKQYSGVGKDSAEKFTGNEATRHGEYYEDEAVELFEGERGLKVLFFGLMPFVDYGDFLGGSVDGITACGALVEVKCPYRRQPKKEIPAYYLPQIQSMMHGFGLYKCYFIEYVPESQWRVRTLNIHDVPRDNEFMNTNYPSLREFWHRVCVCRTTTETTGLLYSPHKKQPKKRRKRESPGMMITV